LILRFLETTLHLKSMMTFKTRTHMKKLLITTGAGDHFNAGFAQGQMLGLDPDACLGVYASGHYVRTTISPSLDDLDRVLGMWGL
jgi:hypothetical protein